jgi:hypothetical protein
MLRYFLDNTQVVNEPIGGDTITERLYYSEELFSNLAEINGNLTFWGDEYDYLLGLWTASNCDTVDIIIEKFNASTNVWDLEFKGFIYLSDVIFNDDKRQVECEIIDNSFIAMIDNNRSIQMNMNVALSKNLVDISSYYTSNPAGSIFTYTGGGGTYNGRNTISIYNAFAALIAFMTDGLCVFDSVYFSDSTTTYTEGNQYYLVTGAAIASAAVTTLPTISFDELFTDLRRVYNLRIGVETATNGKPLIRIEPKDYFRNTNSYTLDHFQNIKFTRKEGNEFTQIQVGNELSDEVNDYNLFNYIWNTYKLKEYFLSGQCNKKENILDLKMETICGDVRVIEAVQNALIVQDDTVFIYAEPDWNSGVDEFWNPLDPYSPGTNYNNKSLTNGRIIDRWQDDIFSGVSLLDYYVYDMLASLDTPQTVTGYEDIVFDNDSTNGNYDNGGSYDNLTGLYTCVITGTYIMRFSITLTSAGGSSTFDVGFGASFGGGPNSLFWYYDGQSTSNPQTLLTGQSFTYELEYEVPLLEGTDLGGGILDAIISVMVNKTAGAGTLTVDSGSFEMLTPASGIFRNFTSNGQYSKDIMADGSIDSATWRNIKANRDYKLRIQGVNNIHEGYGVDLERNIMSGKTTLKALGKP